MSGPNIRRAPRPERGFTILGRDVTDNHGLSWQARGVLGYLLARPDNWQVNVAHLTKETRTAKKKTGRDGVYAIIDELCEAGFIQREQTRGEGGSFGSMTYIVHESPVPESDRTVRAEPDQAANDNAPPLTGKPDPVMPGTGQAHTGSAETGAPDAVNPPLINTDLLTKTDSKTKTELTNADAALVRLNDEIAAIQTKWAPSVSKPEDLDPQVWLDFLKPRLIKRQELTPTAMKSIESAAAKAGMSTAQAIAFAAERGWLAFRYEYWISATGGSNIHPIGSGQQYGSRAPSGSNSLDDFDDSAFG